MMTSYFSTFLSKKNIVLSLTALLVSFVGIYGYFLQQTVQTVVDRSSMEREIAQLRSEIGDAEQNFGANISAATLDKAKELGFERVSPTRFVTRDVRDATLVTANVANE